MSTTDDFRDSISRSMNEMVAREYRNSRAFSHADVFYNQLSGIIEKNEKSLKEDEQIIVTVYLNNGQAVRALVFGYKNPDMLIIHGTDELNNPIMVICHKNSVQLSLQIVKIKPTEIKKQFGFLAPE